MKNNINKCKFYYVYRITNTVLGKHYYGKRTCSVLPELDIGIKYFSSSKDKKFKQDQLCNPDNYKYKIIKICNTAEEAVMLEIKLHHKFNVGVNPNFYNKAKQTSTKFDTTGIKPSEESILKAKIKRKGFKHSEEAKRKMAISKYGNKWNVGKKRPKEVIDKMKLSCPRGKNNKSSVLVDVFNYASNELVAGQVVLNEWCGQDKSLRSNLAATLRADRSIPSTNRNPWQSKGFYAKYSNALENTPL